MGTSDNVTAKRLMRRDGAWVLEMERLVPIDRRILRPTIERFEGEELILFHLERARGGRELAAGASQIMCTSGPNTEDRAYEPLGETWAPVAPSLRRVAPSEIAIPRMSLLPPDLRTGDLGRVRRETQELQKMQDWLRDKVASLERSAHPDIAEKMVELSASLAELSRRLLSLETKIDGTAVEALTR